MKRVLATGMMLGFGLLAAMPLVAQDQGQMSAEQQRDWFVGFVEGQLSTPERQIRISNIDGALSSTASIREVTISDKEGVWLRVNNAAIDWDQGALFTGRLLVRSLTADSIEYLRNAIPSGDPNLPAPEAAPLAIPDFPVAIQLDKLSIPKVTFGENVFGLGSEISVDGNFRLEGGSLDTALNIVRLDGPGGKLDVAVAYKRADNSIDVGVTLTEPPNGILANLLNIEGKPEMALAVNGSGPVADLRTTMTLDAGGKRALEGLATIVQKPEGMAVDADLGGAIGMLVAPAYQPFFGAQTSLKASALLRSAGGVEISGLKLSGGQLGLEASGTTTADGFLSRLNLAATIADPAGNRVILPAPGAATSIDSATLNVDFSGAGSDDWSADLVANGFANGGLRASEITLRGNGIASNLEDPAGRRLTFNADGMVSGIVSADADVQAALGDSAGLGLAGLWNAGEPLQLAQFRLVGKALSLGAAGTIDDNVFDGQVAIETSSIAPFSGVAGRDLDGAMHLTATGTVSPLIGGFNLKLDGTADNLALSEPALDQVLEGTVKLSGRVARTAEGLEAEAFRIANDNVQIAADGTFATGAADFSFSAALADLALVSDQAKGALTLTGTARGKGAIALDVAAKVPSGALAGKSLSDAAFGFTGQLAEDGTLTGQLKGDAFLERFRVALGGDVAVDAKTKRLTGLRFEAGPTLISGDVVQDADGLLTGELTLASPNVTTAAALLLVDATGSADASITLTPAGGKQSAEIIGSIAKLATSDIEIGAAEIRASVSDLFGVPAIDGTVNGRAIAAGGISIDTLEAQASRSGEATAFDLTAALANRTNVALAGSLAPLEAGYRLALDRAELTQGQLRARLAQPTALAIAGDTVRLDAVQLDVGGGRISATGSAGAKLDIALEVQALPLSIANAIAPDLGLAGTLNGSGRITGSASDPAASFSISGSGVSAAAISEFGITPMQFSGRGSFAKQTLVLESASAQGAGGLQLTASGRVPLNGRGLAVEVQGSAPLALGNRFVADRGGQLSGTANLNARVTGSLGSPQFAGTVSTSGSGYIDPALNLRLVDITGRASLAGNRINIDSLTAGLATGGSLSVGGSVGLGAGNPADIAVRLNSARYADGNMFVATVSGDLALKGRLDASPMLSGNVMIEKADITIPDSLGAAGTIIDAKHLNAPKPVLVTLKRAAVTASGAPLPQRRPSVVQLDVNVSAPNQIFIRGRGLDAEVGGSVRLTGSVNDIRPVGGFQLNRGRLAILGQRVTFEEGSVTLVGDLDPFLDFTARTEGDGITVFVNVTGRVSELDIGFSSNPVLPEDEVLSRLLFKRSMGELTPIQLAKLAGAAAELAGGGGGSLVDSLRAKAGLDDLDVVTNEDGSLAVQAGAYLQDNIYLGVQAGADGNSRVTVNLDITKDVRAKVSTGTDGDSSFGVFYESDY
ncbi:translocation/assembly module TamB domain-containing protein [Devosia sp. LjRoot16]|uniref:translocation/assembly module TamB domain-containing protein n=1 Tax=Devosia sp. LjRoot16 TaxID=3342271 RepID=UPI003ED13C0F